MEATFINWIGLLDEINPIKRDIDALRQEWNSWTKRRKLEEFASTQDHAIIVRVAKSTAKEDYHE